MLPMALVPSPIEQLTQQSVAEASTHLTFGDLRELALAQVKQGLVLFQDKAQGSFQLTLQPHQTQQLL